MPSGGDSPCQPTNRTQGLQRAAEMVMRLAPDVACFQEIPAAHEKNVPFGVVFEKNYHPKRGGPQVMENLFLIFFSYIIIYV